MDEKTRGLLRELLAYFGDEDAEQKALYRKGDKNQHELMLGYIERIRDALRNADHIDLTVKVIRN